MLNIRKYDDSDFFQVSKLIQQVFKKYIQPDATPDGTVYWSAFHSLSAENLKNIEDRFKSCPIRMVAELNNEIVGTVMGTTEELVRIFVCEKCHGKGIGKKLIKSFDSQVRGLEVSNYKITASLYAVPFYKKMGCKKSTGIRNFHGLKVQPMKKFL